jgi:hypothetical protein
MIFVPSVHNSVFDSILSGLEPVGYDDAKVVLLWNDVNSFERTIIDLARMHGKKVVVLQHGRKGTSKYFPPFNERIRADKILVWGDFDKRSLVAVGQDAQKIRVVGSPVLHNLPPKKPHEGYNIVFCPEHWDKEVPENEQVRDILRQFKGGDVRITTKIIESHDPERYDNPVRSDRNLPNHLRICGEVLATADLVVGVSESTFELMAQAMDIPVVIMKEWEPKACNGDERYKTYRRVISSGSKQSSLADLKETILDQLANPEELREERAKVVVDEGGINLDTVKLIKEELYG